MNYSIREIEKCEYGLLKDFLYEAIFIPKDGEPPPKTITASPEMQVYIKCFGESRDDRALVAESGGKIIGAVWVRIMKDYGHIDDETPSFAISLYREYRGLGIGTAMMREMLLLLKESGYKRASLAVQKANYAVNMYQRLGFETVRENLGEYIMVKQL